MTVVRGSFVLFSGLVALSLANSPAHAQLVGTAISSTGALPNANALLDLHSPAEGDGKGLLIPRVTGVQRTSAQAALNGGLLDDSGDLRGGAAQGLLVYQTDGTQGFYYNTSATATPSWAYVGRGDFMADGSVPVTGTLDMNGHSLTNVVSIAFSDSVALGAGASSFSSLAGSVAIGSRATARYRTAGVAVGSESDGDYNGIAIGYQADGQYSNIAIGYASSAYSGYDRIAIGRNITNRVNNSAAIRGTLYLDGGTGVYYRPIVGTGTWSVKAFTIDHPLDSENKVLRHYCLEGPEVWNVYAGQAILRDGRAVVALPDYYSALNKAGSEIYSLTPVGGFADLCVLEKARDNRFLIGGSADVEVSWSIKVLRNDPGCLEDLERRPVEQLKSELVPGRIEAENQVANTLPAAP